MSDARELLQQRHEIGQKLKVLLRESSSITNELEELAVPIAKSWYHFKRRFLEDEYGRSVWWADDGITRENVHVRDEVIEIGYRDYDYESNKNWFEVVDRLPIEALWDDSWKEPLREDRREWLLKKREQRRRDREETEAFERARYEELAKKYGGGQT